MQKIRHLALSALLQNSLDRAALGYAHGQMEDDCFALVKSHCKAERHASPRMCSSIWSDQIICFWHFHRATSHIACWGVHPHFIKCTLGNGNWECKKLLSETACVINVEPSELYQALVVSHSLSGHLPLFVLGPPKAIFMDSWESTILILEKQCGKEQCIPAILPRDILF